MPRWEEIQEGSEPPATTIGPLTVTDAVRYQGASGDMNPIHHDPAFARDAGFDRPLMVGMFQAGVLANWAADWLGPENVRRIRVRWRRPVWPGDVLRLSGRVAKRYEEGTERRVDLDLACANQDGDIVVQGWMTFVVPG